MPRPSVLLNFCLCMLAPLSHQQISKEFGGPFRIIPYQLEQCEDSGTNDISLSSSRISKVSRTKYVYSSNVTIAIPFSNELDCSIDVAIWGNGGWRPHYFQETIEKMCFALETYVPEILKEMVKSGNITCPLPAGNYEIKEMDMSKIQLSSIVPIMPYGKFRGDASIQKDGNILGCIRGYYDIVPKKPVRPNLRKPMHFY